MQSIVNRNIGKQPFPAQNSKDTFMPAYDKETGGRHEWTMYIQSLSKRRPLQRGGKEADLRQTPLTHSLCQGTRCNSRELTANLD